MKKQQIVICDSNMVYARRLQEYWSEERLAPCGVVFYTEWEKCREYMESHPSTVCVVSEDVYEEKGCKKELSTFVQCWLVLCESQSQMPENGIFRFQSAESLIKQICEKAGIKSQTIHGVHGGNGMKLIGIYTPVRRCLQTSFALVLGQMLASKHRVLYLNFEAYSGFSQMMQRSFHADMAELLYFYKNLSRDFSQKFAGMKESINGLDFIPPAFSFMDITGILPSEWENFFRSLGEIGEYDYIILDLTDYVQGLFQILRDCDYVYTITQSEGRALAKVAHYENLLRELSYDDVLEKTRKCAIPVFRQLPTEVEELMYSQLADYARKILREDFDFA